MLDFLLLILLTFISFIICSTILCTTKKQSKNDGKTTASMDDPPSKKCNTKGGLLADDPDLKSLKLRAKEQKKGAQSTITTPGKPSTLEGTDLRSLDDKGKNKERVPTAIPPEQQKAMSAYVNKTGVNQDGMSVLAMAKVDKDKLPPKMAPKEPEVVAQDSTQADDSQKNSKSKSHTGNKSSSKKAKSVHGADGKKKRNMEDLLDAMMDKTQTTVDDESKDPTTTGSPAPKASTPEGKTQVPTKVCEVNAAATKTKLGEVKTQVPTKVLDLESGRSEKNKKTKQTQKTIEKEEKRSADTTKKVKTPSKRC